MILEAIINIILWGTPHDHIYSIIINLHLHTHTTQHKHAHTPHTHRGTEGTAHTIFLRRHFIQKNYTTQYDVRTI